MSFTVFDCIFLSLFLPFPFSCNVFLWTSSREPGGTASDRGKAEGEAGPLEVHQALENPLLHLGRKPATLP